MWSTGLYQLFFLVAPIIAHSILSELAFEEKERNITSRLRAIPNPYPIPDTRYSIDFHPPTTELNEGNARVALSNALYQYERFIRRRRCGNEYLEPREYQYISIAFGIAPVNVMSQGLIWSDAPKIVDAFKLKSYIDGYRQRWGRIVVTEDREKIVGTALLSQLPHPD